MKKVLIFCLVMMFAYPVMAEDLVFQFINPSFGGNSFNGQWLLNSATIQDPLGFLKAEAKAAIEQDLLKKFKDRLTDRALNELSRKIIDRMFGEGGPLPDEIYYVGDYEIEIASMDDGGVKTTITDMVSGNTTSVEVPYPYL